MMFRDASVPGKKSRPGSPRATIFLQSSPLNGQLQAAGFRANYVYKITAKHPGVEKEDDAKRKTA
ncbi:MAG: hypothetical protein KKD17_00690 [Nanoarchaeota archaeon]|nr:hypothetical protein [Nanoarchaeota archaeon]